jgi:hypothetical protein
MLHAHCLAREEEPLMSAQVCLTTCLGMSVAVLSSAELLGSTKGRQAGGARGPRTARQIIYNLSLPAGTVSIGREGAAESSAPPPPWREPKPSNAAAALSGTSATRMTRTEPVI